MDDQPGGIMNGQQFGGRSHRIDAEEFCRLLAAS
jgi:hypothetical protein